jgi:hypothetical protein
MKMRLDMNKIATGLGAERRGEVVAAGGYFGAVQLAALLLGKKTDEVSEGETANLTRSKRRARR